MDQDLKHRLDERLVEGKITLEEYQEKLKLLNRPVEKIGQSSKPAISQAGATRISFEPYLPWAELSILIIVGLFAIYWHVTQRRELPGPIIFLGAILILRLIAKGFKRLFNSVFSSTGKPAIKRKKVRRRVNT